MVKYLGTAGTGIPPETRVTFNSLEEYVDHQKNPSQDMLNLGIGKLDAIYAVDGDNGEYNPTYVEPETDKRGNPRNVTRGGEWNGGRELNATEKAELKRLEKK